MRILKDLSELVQENVISNETAERITAYYELKQSKPSGKFILIFGILGALLVGTGILLILAHNWDTLPKMGKTALAFFLLMASQFLCGYVVLKKSDHAVWRESAAAFLSLSLASCISLISQIYHISGDFKVFILTWSLLTLPLVYIMRSSVAGLLYIAGATIYLIDYAVRPEQTYKALIYLALLSLLLPYYLTHIKRNLDHFVFNIFHWLLPLSLLFMPVTLARDHGEWVFVIYLSLLSIFLRLGNSDYFRERPGIQNGYEILGKVGTIILLWTLSFDGFWSTLINKDFSLNSSVQIPEFLFATATTLIASFLLFIQIRSSSRDDVKPIQFVYLLFVPIFIIGYYHQASVLLVNVLTLLLGMLIIRQGLQTKKLGELNTGLIVIAGLVICRFFDSDLSFVFKGLLFVCIGLGFFIINYRMLKNKNKYESQ